MAPGYGMNLGYCDWNAIMNNPYFQAALKSPNINFKGNNPYSSTQGASSTTNTSSYGSTQTETGAIPVTNPSTTQKSGSSLGKVGGIGLAILGAGGVAWMIKEGKLSRAANAAKSLLRGNSGEALSCLRAIKTPDGIRFNIPKKTITKSGNQIENFVKNEYHIPSAISAERQAFNPNSVVEEFGIKINNETYIVYAKDGSISKVVNPNNIGESITDTNVLEQIQKVISELQKEAKDIDKNLLKDVTQIGYVNTYGDDVLKLTADKYGADPRLREFTTLQRFKFSDPEVQAYQLQAGEKVFTIDKFYKDGKLIDGLTVSEFSDKIGGGNIGNFEGQTLVSIVKPDGSILPQGSAGYEAIVEQQQKDIDKLIHKIFVKREYIPDGATIVKG